MLQVLTDPNGFFRGRVVDPPLRGPLAVVLLAGIVNGISALVLVRRLLSALPEQAGPFVAVGAVLGGLFTVVVYLVQWAFFTGVFYGLSLFLFGGQGPFRSVLAATGYGFLPAVFAGAVNAAATWYALQSVTFPGDAAGMGRVAAQLQHSPPLLVASALGVVFTLWQGFIWTFGVRHSRNVSLRQAAATVAVPVLALALWTAWNLRTVLG